MSNATIEDQALDHAARRLGISPLAPRRPGQSITEWRQYALLHIGAKLPQGAATQADVLNEAGRIAGRLYPVVERGRGGQEFERFYGSPAACWDRFKSEPLRLRRFVHDPINDHGDQLVAVRNGDGRVMRFEYSDGRPVPS